VGAGGMGARRAEAAARAMLDAWSPDLLVIAGVAGALSPTLRLADVLVASAVETESGLLEPPVVPPTSGIAVSGVLAPLDRVLVTAAEKKAAVHTHSPTPPRAHTAVEMETGAAARVAVERGIPWAAVRAVSDTAEESLPLDFNRLRKADGNLCA